MFAFHKQVFCNAVASPFVHHHDTPLQTRVFAQHAAVAQLCLHTQTVWRFSGTFFFFYFFFSVSQLASITVIHRFNVIIGVVTATASLPNPNPSLNPL